MNLRDKLLQFASGTAKPKEQSRPVPQLDGILGGREETNTAGSFYLVERVYPLNHQWGARRLGEVFQIDVSKLARLAKDQTVLNLKFSDTLFVDTETTGLAGGTGTYAFLVGVGRFIGSQFVVRQYLMRDYNEETAMLMALRDQFGDISGLVTFNGKRFDWPLIRDRFTLARMAWPGTSFVHLDLLHAARRLWRESLPSCSLSHLERSVLGVHRSDDVPGIEVPQLFFEFLRTGQGTLLQGILQHNADDILSLAALIPAMVERLETAPWGMDCPWEMAAIGRLFYQEGLWGQAAACFEAVLDLAPPKMLYQRVLSELAQVYKRSDRWPQAEELWRRLIGERPGYLPPYEELAKYYEHRRKDLTAAQWVTQQALAVARRYHPHEVNALQRRMNRLREKHRISQETLDWEEWSQ